MGTTHLTLVPALSKDIGGDMNLVLVGYIYTAQYGKWNFFISGASWHKMNVLLALL